MGKEIWKKGVFLLAALLLPVFGVGYTTRDTAASVGGAEPLTLPLSETESQTLEDMAEDWAEALSLRKGEIRYEMMSENMKEQFVQEQIAVQGKDWSYNIGGSSPWVNDYEITLKDDKATIVYDMMDSTPQHYEMIEILKFGKTDGKPVVTFDTCSDLRLGGKSYTTLYPTYFWNKDAADHGMLDFLRESVFEVFRQNFGDSELVSLAFDFKDVQKKTRGNGNEEITVDFTVTLDYRQPFRDPDEAEYVRKYLTSDPEKYEECYRGYYDLREYKNNYRFVCQTLPGAEDMTEDECFPETFRLYVQDSESTPFSFSDKTPAAKPSSDCSGLCGIVKMPEGNAVLVEQQLWIQERGGRTNNGYFVLNTENAEGFDVAPDAIITLWDGDVQKRVGREEWIEILKHSGNNAGKSYFVEMRQDGGEAVILNVAEVYRP